jgi:predicted permease
MPSGMSKGRRERELDEEIQSHLRLAVADRVRNGEKPESASAAARREFGNRTLIQEAAREAWAWSWVDRAAQDFRHAVRSLLRTSGSTSACIVTLSLGIAASTAMFTLIDSLLLRPLPYSQPDRLVAIEPSISWGDAVDIERHSSTVRSVGVYRKRTFGFTDASQSTVEVVLAGMVTHGFFETLRVSPVLGTAFAREQEIPGANHAIWLTHDFWQRRYSASPAITGAIVQLNGAEYRVAGVLPAGFQFPMDGENPDVYIPLDRTDYCCKAGVRTLGGIARLRERTSRGAAATEVSAISSWHYDLAPLQSGLLGERERPLILLGLAAALLLLVAATNASSILLARAARSWREAAIKTSLGAQLRHLILEHAAQGIVIAVVAAALGLSLATVAIRFPLLSRYQKIAPLGIDGRVIVFAIAVALLSSVGAALIPLFLSGRKRHGSVRNLLAIIQIALSSTLLCTGAMIFGHLQEILKADKGFRTDQIVIAGIGLPEKRYDTDAKMIELHERVVARLARIPGVQDAGVGGGLPMAMRTQFETSGRNLRESDRPSAMVGVADPNVLRILGITLLQGRGFTRDDRYGHPYVALVNRKFLDRYQQLVGSRLRVKFWDGQMKPWSEYEVIGVVSDARNRDIERDPEPEIYLSALQVPLDGPHYFVRTSLPASSLVEAFRRAVWSEDPALERVTPQPFARYVEKELESRRLAIWLIGIFASLALTLATAGLGASISSWVTESLREIGIRSALGETQGGIVRRVVRRSLRISALGILAAIPATFATLAVFRNQISGVGNARIAPLAGVATIGILAALVASAIPAYRAARLNPMDVLRRG